MSEEVVDWGEQCFRIRVSTATAQDVERLRPLVRDRFKNLQLPKSYRSSAPVIPYFSDAQGAWLYVPNRASETNRIHVGKLHANFRSNWAGPLKRPEVEQPKRVRAAPAGNALGRDGVLPSAYRLGFVSCRYGIRAEIAGSSASTGSNRSLLARDVFLTPLPSICSEDVRILLFRDSTSGEAWMYVPSESSNVLASIPKLLHEKFTAELRKNSPQSPKQYTIRSSYRIIPKNLKSSTSRPASSGHTTSVGRTASDRCGRCNKTLSDPNSLISGLGPCCQTGHSQKDVRTGAAYRYEVVTNELVGGKTTDELRVDGYHR